MNKWKSVRSHNPISFSILISRHIPGPLLGEIRQHFKESVNHENLDRSLYIYSGHDVNVVGLWRSLGYTELLEPEYGASIVLELHEEVEQDSFFVKVSVQVCVNIWLTIADLNLTTQTTVEIGYQVL